MDTDDAVGGTETDTDNAVRSHPLFRSSKFGLHGKYPWLSWLIYYIMILTTAQLRPSAPETALHLGVLHNQTVFYANCTAY